MLHPLLLTILSSSVWPPPRSRYDAIVVGTGLKESLLAGLLAQNGKLVLQLESADELGGPTGAVDLQQLSELTEGPGGKLSEAKLGKPSDYRIERAPKMFIASGQQLQLLVHSGAWQQMNPPGFKRVHRALMYRKRPDGQPDVHRVLANSEDVLKTRMLAPLEKARVVQFFLWVEKYDENDSRTHSTGTLSKVAALAGGVISGGPTLDLKKMSASKFLLHWELPPHAVNMIVRGMALQTHSPKALKKMKAIELVRRLKRYKDAYRTFPHMTSPYVYPVGGFGAGLAKSSAKVVEASGGSTHLSTPVDALLTSEDGSCGGVSVKGTDIEADCVVAGPEAVPDMVDASYQIVRLYAVLNHPPNLCKDANSCQVRVCLLLLLLASRHSSLSSTPDPHSLTHSLSVPPLLPR